MTRNPIMRCKDNAFFYTTQIFQDIFQKKLFFMQK